MKPFSRIYLSVLWPLLVFSIFYLHFFTLSAVISLCQNFTIHNLVIFFVTTCTAISMKYSLYAGLWRRKKLMKFYRELTEVAERMNPSGYERLRRSLTIVLGVLSAYSVTLSLMGYFSTASKYATLVDLFSFSCFWCKFPSVPPELVRIFVVIDYVTFPFCSVTLSALMVIGYCFQVTLLTLFCRGFARNWLRSGDLEIRALRIHFQQLLKYLNKMNKLYQDMMVVWYACTLFNCCQGIVRQFAMYSDFDALFNVYVMTFHYQDMVSLMTLTLLASRVPEEISTSLKQLPSVEMAMKDGGHREIQFIYTIMSRPHGLRIGGCILITKGLLISFVGLGVTYAVVFLQLSPDALKRLNGGNSTCDYS